VTQGASDRCPGCGGPYLNKIHACHAQGKAPLPTMLPRPVYESSLAAPDPEKTDIAIKL
jgi:hypothetical protein